MSLTTQVLPRRAATQVGLLASVVAVVLVGAVLLGTCLLLLTTGQASALDATLGRADPDDVEVAVAFRVGDPDAQGVVGEAAAVLADRLAPTDPVVSGWYTSDVRRLAHPAEPYGYLAAGDSLTEHAELLDGRWPAPAGSPGAVEVAVPEVAADHLGLPPGTEIVLEEVHGGTVDGRDVPAAMTLHVVGTYRSVADAAGTWDRDLLGGAGHDPSWTLPTAQVDARVAAYGPFVVSPDELLATDSAVQRVSIHAQPDLAVLPAASRDELRREVADLRDELRSTLGDRVRSLRVTTGLARSIAAAQTQQRVTGSAVLVTAVLGLGLGASALSVAGRLVAGRRADEVQLLTARGARRSQLVTQAAAEGAGMALVAAVVAPPVSVALYRWLTRSSPDGTATEPAAVTPLLVGTVLAGALLLAGVLVFQAWRATDRPRRARRGARAAVARTSAELLLVGAAVVGVLQVRTQELATGAGPDPVLVLTPVLVVLAGAALALRALPWAARRAEARAGRSRRLMVPLATWDVARRPHGTGAALLLVVATASGTFALSLAGTWSTSADDQAAASVGTDLAVGRDGRSAVAQAHGLAAATDGVALPVTDREVLLGTAVGEAAPDSRLVAPSTADAAGLLRGRLPAGTDWQTLTDGLAPATEVAGAVVRAGAELLHLSVVGGTGSDDLLLEVVPSVTVQTAGGARESLTGDDVPLDGAAHDVVIPLPRGSGAGGELEVVAVTLRLAIASSVDRWSLTQDTARADLTVTITQDGGAAPVTSGAARWWATAGAASQDRVTRPEVSVDPGGDGTVLRAEADVRISGLTIGSGSVVLTAFEPPADVPVLLTGDLARRIAVGPGDLLELDVGRARLTARVLDVVPPYASFPHGANVLADHDTLSRAVLAQGSDERLTDVWWMTGVDAPQEAARAVADLGLGDPQTRAGLAEQLRTDPLQLVLRASLLLLVGAAGVLAICGTVVQTAAAVQTRAVDIARLSGMGVPRRVVVGALALEHVLVAVLLVTAGALVGALVSWLVGPHLVVSAAGTAPVPPAQPRWPWAEQGALLGVLLLGCAALVVPVAAVLVRRAGAAHLRMGDA